MATDSIQIPDSDFTLADIYQITVGMAEHIVQVSNRRSLRKSKVVKAIVDVTFKSLGKVTEEHIKGLAASGAPHAELFVPLSVLGGAAVDELGKSFADVILELSATDDKFIDQLMKAGFQNAKLIFEDGPDEAGDKYIERIQEDGAINQLETAAQAKRSDGEMIAIRWMQALICLRHDAKFKAKQYLRLCLPAMTTMRQKSEEVMLEYKDYADYDQGLLDLYEDDPSRIIFKWSTMEMDDMGMGGESYREYNERTHNPHDFNKKAMLEPESMKAHVQSNRNRENTQRRLIRALDFFIDFANDKKPSLQ